MTNPTATVTHLTAEDIISMQQELADLRRLQANYITKHDRIRNTLREASNQLSYLVLTTPDGLGVSLMENQAAGLCTILENIKQDVDEVRAAF